MAAHFLSFSSGMAWSVLFGKDSNHGYDFCLLRKWTMQSSGTLFSWRKNGTFATPKDEEKNDDRVYIWSSLTIIYLSLIIITDQLTLITINRPQRDHHVLLSLHACDDHGFAAHLRNHPYRQQPLPCKSADCPVVTYFCIHSVPSRRRLF